MIGKPYAGQLRVRFDEGGLDGCLWATLNGHEAGNGGYSHLSTVSGTGRRVGLRMVEPVLCSTESLAMDHNSASLTEVARYFGRDVSPDPIEN